MSDCHFLTVTYSTSDRWCYNKQRLLPQGQFDIEAFLCWETLKKSTYARTSCDSLVTNKGEHNYEETKNTIDVFGAGISENDRMSGEFSVIAKAFILEQPI